jgi:hypothetical protein
MEYGSSISENQKKIIRLKLKMLKIKKPDLNFYDIVDLVEEYFKDQGSINYKEKK